MSLALACLAPWALGLVHAQAELGLELGIVLLVIAVGVRAAWGDWSPEWRRRLFCLPSLALAGLTVLALAQAMPLPKGVLSHLAPATQALRAGVVPEVPERAERRPESAGRAAGDDIEPRARGDSARGRPAGGRLAFVPGGPRPGGRRPGRSVGFP